MVCGRRCAIIVRMHGDWRHAAWNGTSLRRSEGETKGERMAFKRGTIWNTRVETKRSITRLHTLQLVFFKQPGQQIFFDVKNSRNPLSLRQALHISGDDGKGSDGRSTAHRINSTPSDEKVVTHRTRPLLPTCIHAFRSHDTGTTWLATHQSGHIVARVQGIPRHGE